MSKNADGAKEHHVGIAIVDGIGAEAFIAATRQSFADAGITKLLFMPVADALILPYAAQNLISVCEVVVAGAVLTNDAIGSNHGALSQTLVASITQLGLISASCVIPAIVSQSSLLEAKAVLPALAQNWAHLSKAALGMKMGTVKVQIAETVPTPLPPVITAEVATVSDLLAAFTASLKVSPSLFFIKIFYLFFYILRVK